MSNFASFLGRGVRFPIIPDASGRLRYCEGEENVEQSVRLLLLTSFGERTMRFEFGCRANDMLFAGGGDRNLRMLESTVREALRDWEPRIELNMVRAESRRDANEVVDVYVSYTIRATNTRTNLVFPFYTEQSDAS